MIENKRIKIAIADDHQIVLEGFESILNNDPCFKIIATANNGNQVLDILETSPIDIVLLDLNIPVLNGLETTKIIKIKYPNVKILILTMFDDAMHIKEMIDAGVDGYLLKNSSKSSLIRAIESIMEGKPYFDAEVTKNILNKFKQTIQLENDKIVLSERELEIITLVTQGKSNAEIAEQLFLSIHTVKTHRKNINFKLNIHNPAELIHFAKQHHLIS